MNNLKENYAEDSSVCVSPPLSAWALQMHNWNTDINPNFLQQPVGVSGYYHA